MARVRDPKKEFHVLEYHRMYWNEELVKYMPYRPGLDVLALRCGKGLMLDQLDGRSGSAWGIDQALPSETLAPEQTMLAEYERLPFGTDTFDAVFGHQILTRAFHVEHTLQELARVLHSSGRLVLWESRRFLKSAAGSSLDRHMQEAFLTPIAREPFDWLAYPLIALVGRVPWLATADMSQAIAKAAFAVDGLLLKTAALHDRSWHVIVVAEKGTPS